MLKAAAARAGVRVHWQNLNERRAPRGQLVLGPPVEGRAWLSIGDGAGRWAGRPIGLRFEWNLRSRFIGAAVDLHDHDGAEVVFHAAVPPVSLWFSFEGMPRALWERLGLTKQGRRIGVDLNEWVLHLRGWAPEMEWSSRQPWWWDVSIRLDDLLLGRDRFSIRLIEERDVVVPMPEGSYQAHAKLEEHTWTRARWFPRRLIRVDLDLPREGGGIPEPGKGESSWDCEDTASFGLVTVARSIEDGVGHLVGHVLDRRRRYGGASWKPCLKTPEPVVPSAQVAAEPDPSAGGAA